MLGSTEEKSKYWVFQAEYFVGSNLAERRFCDFLATFLGCAQSLYPRKFIQIEKMDDLTSVAPYLSNSYHSTLVSVSSGLLKKLVKFHVFNNTKKQVILPSMGATTTWYTRSVIAHNDERKPWMFRPWSNHSRPFLWNRKPFIIQPKIHNALTIRLFYYYPSL